MKSLSSQKLGKCDGRTTSQCLSILSCSFTQCSLHLTIQGRTVGLYSEQTCLVLNSTANVYLKSLICKAVDRKKYMYFQYCSIKSCFVLNAKTLLALIASIGTFKMLLMELAWKANFHNEATPFRDPCYKKIRFQMTWKNLYPKTHRLNPCNSQQMLSECIPQPYSVFDCCPA